MDCCEHKLKEEIQKNRQKDAGEECGHGEKGGETYTCPMHPHVRQERPGMCPECGMQLLQVQNSKSKIQNPHAAHGGQDRHAGHRTESFLWKFWIALVLTVPLIAYSELPKEILGWRAPQFPGVPYALLALGTVVFFYCGWIFLASAWRELKARLPGMMTLIALAITAAYSFSVIEVLRSAFVQASAGEGVPHTLFWELSTLIAVMLLGHWIEMKAVQGAQGALKELAKLLPDTAERIIQNAKSKNDTAKLRNETEIIAISELRTGDIVLVKPGGKIPADGKVVEGRSELNESIITGESKPVFKQAGDEVIAGSVNGDGALAVEITKIGEGTFLAGVMRLVAEAQASKSRLQLLSDKAAFALTLIAVVAGAVTFAAWFFAKAGVLFATERLVAVLVIACPHALGLAIPLVASISTTLAARHGFLVKRRLALEAARGVDTVLFDKTGTLTKGEFGVSAVLPVGGVSADEVLRLAAAVDNHSEHPLAKAIVAAARAKETAIPAVAEFSRMPGKGTKGKVEDRIVIVGNDTLLAEENVAMDERHVRETQVLAAQGKTVIRVAAGGNLLGSIALADIIREESRGAIRTLKALGVKVVMLTGDSEDVAKYVAQELGLDDYFAKVLPHQKADKVKLLQQQGRKVAMVGDGVNDAPALTQADLGIAVGAGTNVAIESAGIILMRNDPRDIPKIIRLSQLTYQKMIQNLFWATGYNVVALPLAAGVFAAQGVVLQPAVAAALMSVSTVVVALNAVLLWKRKL